LGAAVVALRTLDCGNAKDATMSRLYLCCVEWTAESTGIVFNTPGISSLLVSRQRGLDLFEQDVGLDRFWEKLKMMTEGSQALPHNRTVNAAREEEQTATWAQFLDLKGSLESAHPWHHHVTKKHVRAEGCSLGDGFITGIDTNRVKACGSENHANNLDDCWFVVYDENASSHSESVSFLR
jgi:hypothetical protein